MSDSVTNKRERAEQQGRDGEAEAARWLGEQGWEIIAQRVKTPAGEVDLIARRPGITAFIEVKWRRRMAYLAAAIDERRLARVAAAVEAVGHKYAQEGDDWRVDVILLAPGAHPHHIENAWMP